MNAFKNRLPSHRDWASLGTLQVHHPNGSQAYRATGNWIHMWDEDKVRPWLTIAVNHKGNDLSKPYQLFSVEWKLNCTMSVCNNTMNIILWRARLLSFCKEHFHWKMWKSMVYHRARKSLLYGYTKTNRPMCPLCNPRPRNVGRV